MKKVFALILTMVMLLSVSSFAFASEAEKPLKLQWFQSIGIDSLFEDPWHDFQSLYPYMVFDALLSYEPNDASYVPKLAESYEMSEDGLTYTFTLREGVKWSDGEDFTADDVVMTFNKELANPDCTLSDQFLKVEGYDALVNGETDTLSGLTAEGNVVTFKLTQPVSLFLHNICSAMILPSHLLADVAPADFDTYEAFWSKPVGTGIYTIDQVSFPDYFTLVANDSYFGEKAGIANVQFTSYDAGGNDAVVAALITGDLDFAFGNAINDITVANNVSAQNPDVKAMVSASTYTRMFLFNIDQRSDGKNKADIANAKVRQAFDMIINKNAIASFYGDQAVAMSTFCNPANSQYNDDIPLPAQDIETAKAMLEEAGFDFSQTIDISYYYDDQTTNDIMALITQDFASAGVTVSTNLLTGDLGTQIYTDANFDMLYCAAAPDVACGNYETMYSASYYTFIGDTATRGPLYDDLMSTYQSSSDEAELKDVADQMQALDYEYRYSIPVYALNAVSVINTAHLSVPEDIFEVDDQHSRNYRFEDWALVG